MTFRNPEQPPKRKQRTTTFKDMAPMPGDMVRFKIGVKGALRDLALQVSVPIRFEAGQEIAAVHIRDDTQMSGPGGTVRKKVSILRTGPTLHIVVPEGSFETFRPPNTEPESKEVESSRESHESGEG